MKTHDFNYNLPEQLIAQTPLENRDMSKLMVLNRRENKVSHCVFKDIVSFLNAGDCLVLNDTSVLPARIFGRRSTGASVEFLLLSQNQDGYWECLVKPGRKAKVDDTFTFGDGLLNARIVAIIEEGIRLVKFEYEGVFENILEQIGSMPLPPYIHERLEKNERYQTVYNRVLGSAAAPTAGLHFTDTLIEKIKEKGVEIAYVTLHVGLGTFRPVKVDEVSNHKMHAEWYALDKDNAMRIKRVKENGGRIISVGTTSTRTLESIYQKHGEIKGSSGWTDIFIYPGYTFNTIDGLITNFHLPESTLLMLVSAFYDKARVLDAYQLAIEKKYRFFSFGDAMFIE